jgi:hypothetical protein
MSTPRKCQAQCPEKPHYIYHHRCSRNAKVEVAGLHLCGQHGRDLEKRIARFPAGTPVSEAIPYGWGVNMPREHGRFCRYGDCS